MIVKFENLGIIRKAEFELGDLTIICGKNNTGKTYITHTLYGFLHYWKNGFNLKINDKIISKLLLDGNVKLDISEFIKNADKTLNEASKKYNENIYHILVSQKKMFENTKFSVVLNREEIKPLEKYEIILGTTQKKIFQIVKQNNNNIIISFLVEKDQIDLPTDYLKNVIGKALKEIIFGTTLPNIFVASTERTGAAIFLKELDFARNRLLEDMSKGAKSKSLDPFKLLDKVYSSYPLPVLDNVDFARQLEDISKEESFISEKHPEILEDFKEILGGEFTIVSGDIRFIPKINKRLKLTMNESSSSVLSLRDIGYYLRHIAKKGDLLLVDEPELSLHPENQRLIARLFAKLINIGIKVFITTHSDYIIKELNTLIMLENGKKRLKKFYEKEGYKKDELISPAKIRVYIAEKAPIKLESKKRRSWQYTLSKALIDPEYGIEAQSFDNTINDMNRIQEAIIFEEGIQSE